ncbi:MAG: hypothetical protein ACRDKI_08615 [Solirubrobacterales bacterium]
MTFDSYYWRSSRLSTPELERARVLVATAHDRTSFALLLRSNDMAAVGIAFDQYHYADASSRHGSATPFGEYCSEVAARAREVLRQPPSDSAGGIEAGANHASALGALANLAEPEDAELIVQVFRRAAPSNLRFAAALAARSVLENSISPNEQLISELEKVVFDESTASEERRAALAALGRARSEFATDALLRVLHVSDPSLQASSALHLLDRDLPKYRTQVEEIARTWPKDPPYPADEVIELLAESSGVDGR